MNNPAKYLRRLNFTNINDAPNTNSEPIVKVDTLKVKSIAENSNTNTLENIVFVFDFDNTIINFNTTRVISFESLGKLRKIYTDFTPDITKDPIKELEARAALKHEKEFCNGTRDKLSKDNTDIDLVEESFTDYATLQSLFNLIIKNGEKIAIATFNNDMKFINSVLNFLLCNEIEGNPCVNEIQIPVYHQIYEISSNKNNQIQKIAEDDNKSNVLAAHILGVNSHEIKENENGEYNWRQIYDEVRSKYEIGTNLEEIEMREFRRASSACCIMQ
jgi:hypothetical protein